MSASRRFVHPRARAWSVAVLLVAAAAPAGADEPAQPDAGFEQNDAAACDACSLRHRSKLRNRDRLRELRRASEEQQGHEAGREAPQAPREHDAGSAQ